MSFERYDNICPDCHCPVDYGHYSFCSRFGEGKPTTIATLDLTAALERCYTEYEPVDVNGDGGTEYSEHCLALVCEDLADALHRWMQANTSSSLEPLREALTQMVDRI